MNKFRHQWRAGVFGALFGIIVALSGVVIADSTIEPAGTTEQQKLLPIKDVQRFTSAISHIKNFYVEPISDNKLFDNAIRGMLTGLDPHSDYLDADEYKELTSATKGEFSGLGIEVTMEDGIIKVIAPIDDSPAAKAGIKPGDLIIALDDTPVKGMTLREAVNRMRGAKGSHIILTVLRKGNDAPLKFDVVRDVVLIKSVKAKLYDGKYGYIRLSNFQFSTYDDLNAAVANLYKDSRGKLSGLILDLRNNPGGLLDSSIAVSDAFLDSNHLGKNNLIVYTKGRVPGANFEAKASPGDLIKGLPMIVLINEGSASAAEIVAGALQDHNRAIVLGMTSFGKGSVQTVLPLDDSTAIKLTTALYYTPGGRSIQAMGIKPDVVVENLNLAQAKKDNSLNMLKEANLLGHIQNSTVNNTNNKQEKANSTESQTQPTKDKIDNQTSNAKPADKNEENLTYTDYQLHEALNLLKGLVITRNLDLNIGNIGLSKPAETESR